MSRAIQLTRHDAELLGRTAAHAGSPVRFRFLQGADQDKRWNLENISNILRSLPGAYQTKAFEVWVTSTEISLVAWAPDKDSAKRIVSHWRNFNPSIQKQPAPYHFPPLSAGAHVRVGRVSPKRAAKYPFDARFGRQGLKLLSSPIVHLLHNIPLLPDGTTLVIQFLWRQHRLPWFWWPWAHWDFRPWLGQDEDALDEKREHRLSYYCDIRIAEVCSTPSDVDHVATTAQAFQVYRRDNANSLAYRPFDWWGRNRILRFLRAMQERNLGAFRQWLWRRPRLTVDELAALVHPPPPGTIVPGLAYTSVRQVGASGTAETQAAALRKAVREKLDAMGDESTVHGRSRKLKARDVEAILRREGGA